MGTYCQKVNQEVAMVDLSTTGIFTCPFFFIEKALDLWKKA